MRSLERTQANPGREYSRFSGLPANRGADGYRHRGCGRSSAISGKISWNICRGMATSAILKAT
jgi:hypothetical protein